MSVAAPNSPTIPYRNVEQLDVKGKKVLVRVDYNVPLDEQGKITDDTRIRETLPTLQYLLSQNASLILCAHLGRPKGKVNPSFSLKPAAARLQELADRPVVMAPNCVGEAVSQLAQDLKPGQILLLENLRFHPEEEANDAAFAKQLAGLADAFVQDAFGAVHRAHASTEGVARLLPSAAGKLLTKEIFFLSKILNKPDQPFWAILGGAKVSDKIEVIDSLMERVQGLVIGGAMAYTFLKSMGISIGASRVEADKLDLAKALLEKARAKKIQIVLPVDHVTVQKIDVHAPKQITDGKDIGEGWMGVDIGPKTITLVQEALESAKTILWNGPMGIFEMEPFSHGTLSVAAALERATKNGATTIVGGGDSVAAVKQAGVAEHLSHISTGGGASLEFLEGKTLPGIGILPKA